MSRVSALCRVPLANLHLLKLIIALKPCHLKGKLIKYSNLHVSRAIIFLAVLARYVIFLVMGKDGWHLGKEDHPKIPVS